jgi:hypothetical protein
MRSYRRTIGGKKLTLKANFAASIRIAEEIYDPLHVAREISLEAYFLENNVPYTPKFQFGIANVVDILSIATGLETEEMGDLCFEEGYVDSKNYAAEYLTKIIGPSPEQALDGGDTKEETPSEK